MTERFILIFTLLIAVLIMACGQSEPVPIPATPTPQIVVVTATSEPTPVSEIPTPQVIMATATSQPASTSPTPQPTYTPYPTQIPLPTYTPYPTTTTSQMIVVTATSEPTPIPATPTTEPITVVTPSSATPTPLIVLPTFVPTATPEPVVMSDCVKNGEVSQTVIPTLTNGTTELSEPLPGIIFQDTIKGSGNIEERAWVFTQLPYEHCKTDDPWRPEFLIIGDQEVDLVPRESDEYISMVFSLGLYERKTKEIYHREDSYTRFAPAPCYKPERGFLTINCLGSILRAEDPEAVLYIWSNRDNCKFPVVCNFPQWVETEWEWKLVSTARPGTGTSIYREPSFWFMPLDEPVPSVFAVVKRQ